MEYSRTHCDDDFSYAIAGSWTGFRSAGMIMLHAACNVYYYSTIEEARAEADKLNANLPPQYGKDCYEVWFVELEAGDPVGVQILGE